ncbi:MAG: leucine-rich repeat domain-containing protein, partial [Spirochaetaceae bacterium]|nr:leucine-rich repeat domain-containing protein [Spirochaetaceae bacterium]
LTGLTIPPSVTSIGRFAFYRTGLTSVTIPPSVASIEYCAFVETNLKRVIISRQTKLEGYVFPQSAQIIYSN